MKKQADLFFGIAQINEQSLSVEELFAEAVHIISHQWADSKLTAAVIKYKDIRVTSENFRVTPWFISANEMVKDSQLVTVKVFNPDPTPILESDQSLVKAIANNLASKIERILSRKQLEENQKLLDKAYKLARIGTWEYDMINDILHWSDVTKEVHGFDEDYIPDVESTVQLFKEGFHRNTFAKAAHDAIEQKIPFDVELKIISGKGDERWIHATGEPEFVDGVCVRFYGISQNVTGRKQAKEDLLLNERRFKALIQDGSDMIAILDDYAIYKYVSPSSETVLGIPAGDLIGKSAFEFIHDNDTERIKDTLSNLSTKERIQIEPFRFIDAQGNWRWIGTTLTNLSDDPAVGGYVANSRDVTERYLRQEEIKNSLKEKETLLAEVHHRVKNNLAVISAMLQLQSMNVENQKVFDCLSDSVTRIRAIADIHEQLYQSKTFSRLDFTKNIRQLATEIVNTFQINTSTQVTFACDHVELNVNQAIPCSLIINEVITNILKHAFSGKKHGMIHISLRVKDDKLKLSIKDNGTGFNGNIKEIKSDSLGLQIIAVLSQQLGAEYDYSATEDLNNFTLEFVKGNIKGSASLFA